MISDILSDAESQARQFLADDAKAAHPIYKGKTLARIKACLDEMATIRIALDCGCNFSAAAKRRAAETLIEPTPGDPRGW